MSNINLSDLFYIDQGHILFELNKDIEKKLINYTSILERLKNTLYFANKIRYKNDNDKSRAEGYLRASLCEVISIEEILKNYDIDLKIYKTKNPLLILLKFLRNIDVHIKTNKIDSLSTDVIFEKNKINFNMIYIKDFDIDKVKVTDSFKKYYKSDLDISNLEESINWFQSISKQWGINELILRAVHIYANLIIKEIEK